MLRLINVVSGARGQRAADSSNDSRLGAWLFARAGWRRVGTRWRAAVVRTAYGCISAPACGRPTDKSPALLPAARTDPAVFRECSTHFFGNYGMQSLVEATLLIRKALAEAEAEGQVRSQQHIGLL